MAVDTQGSGREKSSLKAVSFALAQHALRRPSRARILISQLVDEPLDFCRRLERPQRARILRRQAKVRLPVSLYSVFRQSRTLQRRRFNCVGKLR